MRVTLIIHSLRINEYTVNLSCWRAGRGQFRSKTRFTRSRPIKRCQCCRKSALACRWVEQRLAA